MIDFDALAEEIIEAATAGLDSSARIVMRRAKRRAPVRSIFAGTPKYSHDQIEELSSRRGERAELSGSEDKAAPNSGDSYATDTEQAYERGRNVGERSSERRATREAGLGSRSQRGAREVHAPVWWRQRRLRAAQSLLGTKGSEDEPDPDNARLTRRGRYEVSSMRAAHNTWGHTHIGGRLRDEIFATPAIRKGSGAEAWVISPTAYAKFQEYGSVHNRAHPYLRPAAAESREDIAAIVSAAIKEAIRTRGLGDVIEIVVRV